MPNGGIDRARTQPRYAQVLDEKPAESRSGPMTCYRAAPPSSFISDKSGAKRETIQAATSSVSYFLFLRRDNGGVDAAARIQSSIAGPSMMRNTLPPLASNDLFGITVRK